MWAVVCERSHGGAPLLALVGTELVTKLLVPDPANNDTENELMVMLKRQIERAQSRLEKRKKNEGSRVYLLYLSRLVAVQVLAECVKFMATQLHIQSRERSPELLV